MFGGQVLEKQVVGGEGQGAAGCRLSPGTWVQDSSSLQLRRRRENTWTLSPFSLLFLHTFRILSSSMNLLFTDPSDLVVIQCLVVYFTVQPA